ncbi:hypothetical protein SDC9_206508 [bioreactor metagenome]|uniref:Uncharacterized protein n=1 Tax=bioreactor metagenome TaxID=1076179 RepID=A0A645JGT2_9ZZZZ
MGCPIKASMDTVLLGYSELGTPAYFDKIAYESDGVIVSCRLSCIYAKTRQSQILYGLSKWRHLFNATNDVFVL